MRLDLGEILTKPITDPEWVVRGIVPRGSFIVLAGEAGAGKTMLCYHMALCVVTGRPFLGHYPVTPMPVLYIDEENGLPDSERYWQRLYWGLGEPDLTAITTLLQVEHFSVGSSWEATLTRLVEDSHPGLIVLDTATPVLQIEDENDNAEASRKIQALRHIQRRAANDTTLLVLKHEKTRDDKTHRRTVRGAKTWLGAVDIVMYHSFGRGGSGLRKTYLRADKPRAFGLDHEVEIIPSRTGSEPRRGYRLQCARAFSRAQEGNETAELQDSGQSSPIEGERSQDD